MIYLLLFSHYLRYLRICVTTEIFKSFQHVTVKWRYIVNIKSIWLDNVAYCRMSHQHVWISFQNIKHILYIWQNSLIKIFFSLTTSIDSCHDSSVSTANLMCETSVSLNGTLDSIRKFPASCMQQSDLRCL